MTTIDEAIVLSEAQIQLHNALAKANGDATSFIGGVINYLEVKKILYPNEDVSQFIIDQLAPYLLLLTPIEDAADAIPTDPYGTNQE